MRRIYRKVLKKLRLYFVEHLLLNDDVIDELFSKCAIDLSEAEILHLEKGNKRKVNGMILALSSKDDSIWSDFKKCLKETKNEHVLVKIEAEEQTISREETVPDEQIKHILFKNIEEGPKTSFTSIQQIQDMLYSTRNEHDSVEDIDDTSWLVWVIKTLFPSATDVQSSKPTPRNSKKFRRRLKSENKKGLGFNGIQLKEDSEHQSSRQESECSQTSESEVFQNSDGNEDEVESRKKGERGPNLEKLTLSVDGFYNWIKGVLNDHCGDSSAAERFKEEDIDGVVFNTLNSNEIERLLPKLGQRRKVEMNWKNWETESDFNTASNGKSLSNKDNTNSQLYQQTLRPFDCINAGKHKYRQGAHVTAVDSRRGNPLSPVHAFCILKTQHFTSSKEAINLANEIVKFGSACMNEKTNGTIHFGISSDNIVQGCFADFKLIERKITDSIRQLFYDGQISIAFNCIRPPQFIEVIQENATTDKVYVIEVDVVSSITFVEDFAFFLKQKGGTNKTNSDLYRYVEKVQKVTPQEIENFIHEEKHQLFLSRKKIEDQQIGNSDESRYQRLKNFLCCGNESFEPSIYPLLLLNNMQGCPKKNVEFIRHVDWRAIFDFSRSDEKESTQDYLEKSYGIVFNKNYIEDFDQRKVSETQAKQTVENLKTSSLPNWIYCNGPWQDFPHTDDPRTWKIQRSGSFRKAVEFYFDNFPQGRGRVLIPLFKHGDGLLIEAAEEVFVKFNENCMVLAETETVSDDLMNALQIRNVFPNTTESDECCLTGLPWTQLSEAFTKFSRNTTRFDGFELHRSTGVPFTVPITFRPELCDLDILFMNECYEVAQMNTAKKEELQTKCGEDFYRGNAVSWHNFYFEDQVLLRDIYMPLIEKMQEVISRCGNFNQPVRQVIVYHQPGAGGSTSAKQALWLMRESYRCCVVKNFTKQTTEQISRLRMFGEEEGHRIDPIIVLVDTDDDETVSKLHDELEYESRKHSCEVFCVMLICCRVSEPPTRLKASVFLQQHLSQRELDWFNKKYKDLNEKHSQNLGCDPHTLLALNVMKENFNMDAIGKYVAQYVKDPCLTNEHIRLLKYLSFLNHFDIKFQPVPKDIFDPIMEKLDWILHIPKSMRILVNPVSVNGVSGKIPCLRIANYLLSRPVLDASIEIEKHSVQKTMQTVGEVAKDLLKSKMVCLHSRGEFIKKFERILSDIIKKRSFFLSSGTPNHFSPLIMTLFEAKDYDTAIDIIEKVYEVTDDQMVAQQLARFHAEIGNWEDAYKVIEKAMTVLHDNAYLNHTCGHIYKKQFEFICREKNLFSEDEGLQALQVAQSARFYFKETQRISRSENCSPTNPAGFDGEIRVSIDILKKFYINDVVKQCRGRSHVIPATRKSLLDCPCKFIESIKESTQRAIEELQAEAYLICMNKINLHSDFFLSLTEGNLLKHYRRDFHIYLKKSLKERPSEDTWVCSFIDAAQATEDQLNRVISKQDKISGQIPLQDLRAYIGSVIELMLRHKEIKLEPCTILTLCRQFYERVSESNSSPVCKLEAHLVMLVLHWPLETKIRYREDLCPHSIIISALCTWKKLTEERPNKPSHDKIFCYLSNDTRFPCLVKADNATKNNLNVMTGLICSNGQEVDIKLHAFRTDNVPSIRISSLYPVRISSMWNKQANVVIGFGLNGPKAELLEAVLGNTMSMSPKYRGKSSSYPGKEQTQTHLLNSVHNQVQPVTETGTKPKCSIKSSTGENFQLVKYKGKSKKDKAPIGEHQNRHQYIAPVRSFPRIDPTMNICTGTRPQLGVCVQLSPRIFQFTENSFPPLPVAENHRLCGFYQFNPHQRPPPS